MNFLISLGLTVIVLVSSSYGSAIALPIDTRSNKIAITQKTPLVGAIQSKLESGCGCYFSFADGSKNKNKPVFSYLFSDTPSAIMNIDGQDIKLIGKNKKGFKVERWVYNDILVTITSSLVKSEYEGGSYKAKIVVKRGYKSSIIKATGYCGC
jgi:hypothetical protein